MPVPFGFEVGDFIAALELVGTINNALRESGGSGSEYRELVNQLSQLYDLETALLQVKQLELEDEQPSEHIALRQAASRCQQTIDNFWTKITRYQKHLRTDDSFSKLKDCWDEDQMVYVQDERCCSFQDRSGCSYTVHHYHHDSA